ncbi:helix-turn-helix domain-containing protein [Jannaschia sp. R86511]|uniref:TetR/AcrR family transcriptional regulator n=1 Tax=Jannaschia sp. R86511 TaxID=3093853 RepID=UPI0036D35D4E
MQPARSSSRSNARGRATARRIEAAAVRLATEHGPDALTVDAVCVAAGISQRTFFHHFPTKEDALLGLDLPVLDEERVRDYLSDPRIGVLSGAVSLVRLPEGSPADAALELARLRLVAASPALYRRQGERLLPLLHEVRGLVLTRLRAGAGDDERPEDLERQADLVTAMGAALMQAVGHRAVADGARPTAAAAATSLELLRPVWGRLL